MNCEVSVKKDVVEVSLEKGTGHPGLDFTAAEFF